MLHFLIIYFLLPSAQCLTFDEMRTKIADDTCESLWFGEPSNPFPGRDLIRAVIGSEAHFRDNILHWYSKTRCLILLLESLEREGTDELLATMQKLRMPKKAIVVMSSVEANITDKIPFDLHTSSSVYQASG